MPGRVFLEHAFKRIDGRLSLFPDEVDNLLERNLCVPIAHDQGERRAFSLVFSVHDEKHFVVVEDPVDKKVITVLPLPYVNNLRISLEALNQARRLVQPEQSESEVQKTIRNESPDIRPAEKEERPKTPQKKSFFTCRVKDIWRGNERTIQLKGLSIEHVGHTSLESFLSDPETFRFVLKTLIRRVRFRRLHIVLSTEINFCGQTLADVPEITAKLNKMFGPESPP